MKKNKEPYIKEGERFTKLVALEEAKIKSIKILCGCDCGNKKIIKAQSLKSKNTKSCGCLRKQKSKENGKNNKKHGLSNHSLKAITILSKRDKRC